MELSRSVVFFGYLVADFSVGENLSTYILVVHLELGVHQHNQAHLINIEFASFLQDLYVIKGAPLFGGKTQFKWRRPHHTINFVEGGIIGAAYMVGIVRNTEQNASIVVLFPLCFNVVGGRWDAVDRTLIFERLRLNHRLKKRDCKGVGIFVRDKGAV